MNDKEAAIKQYRDSLTHEYKLVMRIETAKQILEEERKKFFSQSKTTESYKSVLMHEFGLNQAEIDAFERQVVAAAVVA